MNILATIKEDFNGKKVYIDDLEIAHAVFQLTGKQNINITDVIALKTLGCDVIINGSNY
jgi:hypothetical protein